VKDDLLATLEQLVLHRDRFDYILIETTGMANPGPLITSFWTDDNLGSCLKLDSVVCLVDAANILFYLKSADISFEVQQQISYADRILINKVDLVDDSRVRFHVLILFSFFLYLVLSFI
jgi:G3E family GTPase